MIWVNRSQGDARAEPEEADRRGQEPPRGGQAARRRLSRVRAVGLHPDVVVVTSRFWQTTCTLVRRARRRSCIDSPVLPDELELLPAIAEQAGFRWSAARDARGLGPPARPLRVPRRAARRRRVERRAAAQRAGRRAARAARLRRGALRRAPAPAVAPGQPRRCRCPGHCGDRRARARAASGRRAHGRRDGDRGSRGRACSCAATTCRRSRSRGSPRAARVSAYLATLDRLEPLVEQAEHVVPGHGSALDCARARRSCARTAPTCGRCWSAARTRRCRSRGGTARSGRSTRRTWAE